MFRATGGAHPGRFVVGKFDLDGIECPFAFNVHATTHSAVSILEPVTFTSPLFGV